MTDAGLALFARALQEGFTVPVDRMLFADIPGLDTDAEPSPETMRPAAETIVHEGVITNAGKLDANQVIYSYVLPATLGPFYINWIGLYSTQYETLIAIYHVPRHYKSNTSGFQVGNTLYKNFAIQYENIGDLSGITVPPESWQYDFDDRYALKNHDHDTKYEPLESVSTHNQAAAAHKTLFDQKAPLASPAFTGTPTVPTAAAGTNTTQAASTAFVKTAVDNAKITVDGALSSTSTNPVQNKVINTALAAKAPLASPAFTGTPTVPTAAAGTNTTQAASTAFVKTAVDNAKITVDSALSSTSTNPVQNKVINTALAAKAANSHTHSYLPLAGGTMTGSITRDGLLAQNGMSGSNISINGGTGGMNHGGTLGLYDKNHTTDGGCFILRAASDGTNYKDLRGAPDGTLTWMGISLLGTSGKTANGYVKLPDGLIIQWGRGASVSGETTAETTFPIAFPTACLRVIASPFCSNAHASVDGWVQVKSYTESSFVYFGQFNGDVAGIACDYIAIGY